MSNKIIRKEFQGTVLGVKCRFMDVVQNEETGLILTQRIVTESRRISGYGAEAKIQAELRFDDSCGNRHETFSITAEVKLPRGHDVEACGCLHEEIAIVFPELTPLIKWHLTSTDGPLHYVENTLYHAQDRDCWGLRKGEKRPILGPDKVPSWVPKAHETYVKGHEQPAPIEYEVWCQEGEGKDRDLDAARRCAVWPDATDEELCRDDLRDVLEARLPKIMVEFRKDMETVGFVYPERLK